MSKKAGNKAAVGSKGKKQQLAKNKKGKSVEPLLDKKDSKPLEKETNKSEIKPSKKKLKLVTVAEGGLFKKIFFLLIFTAFSAGSFAFVNMKSERFRENLNSIISISKQTYELALASAIDISSNFFEKENETVDTKNVLVLNCDGCPSLDLNSFLNDTNNYQVEEKNYYLASSKEIPVNKSKISSLPVFFIDGQATYPPAKEIFFTPSSKNRVFKGGTDKVKKEFFIYLSFSDPKLPLLLKTLDEYLKENEDVRMYYKYLPQSDDDRDKIALLHCSVEQLKFWQIYKNLLTNNNLSAEEFLNKLSADDEIEIDFEALKTCAQSSETMNEIEKDGDEAKKTFQEKANFVVFDKRVYTTNEIQKNIKKIFNDLSSDIKYEEFMSWGNKDSEILMVEYSDFECPFCQKIAEEVMPGLKENLADKILFIRKDFPISEHHPNAVMAATVARCAGKQNKYWEMHEELFSSQNFWKNSEDTIKIFKNFAEKLELNMQEFEICLEDKNNEIKIMEDFNDGRKRGVRATPTIMIRKKGEWQKIEGILSYKDFERIINE